MPTWQYHARMAKEPYPSEKQDRFIVRLPDGMRDRIADEAKKNNRSMNAELVARLEASFRSTAEQLNLFDADFPRQTAMIELMTLVRQLDVIDLVELVRDLIPSIPDDVISSNAVLKLSLRHMKKLIKRLAVEPDEAQRIAREHQTQLARFIDETRPHDASGVHASFMEESKGADAKSNRSADGGAERGFPIKMRTDEPAISGTPRKTAPAKRKSK